MGWVTICRMNIVLSCIYIYVKSFSIMDLLNTSARAWFAVAHFHDQPHPLRTHTPSGSTDNGVPLTFTREWDPARALLDAVARLRLSPRNTRQAILGHESPRGEWSGADPTVST